MSVGLTATCTDTEIVLHFDRPGSYRIWRKLPHETSWGDPKWYRPLGNEFVDYPIETGIAYEYKVSEMNTGAAGYILAGSKIPLVD